MHRPFFITESQIYLSKEIERIQLRGMRIIFPRSRKSYNEAISLSINLGKLEERCQAACDNLFKEIIEDPNHKLRGTILPDLNSNTAHSLMKTKRTFDFPIIKTNRYMNTFIIASSKRFNS